MFFGIKIFLVLIISTCVCVGIIKCGGGSGSKKRNSKSEKSKSSRRHGKDSKDKKSDADGKEENTAVGHDNFKRPDVLGMATAGDPKYATLRKMDIDNILNPKKDVGVPSKPEEGLGGTQSPQGKISSQPSTPGAV
uniref:Uncharacterized protein n=1 Tax=Parastrongyloides trichosuri TaxID=131310 RepID=A0A0N4ZRU6_PARTI